MKKITLLMCLLLTTVGFSQETIQDFEAAGSVFGPFGGATAELVPDPETGGTRGQVAKLTSTGSVVWQGTNVALLKNLDLTTDKTITIDAYSTTPLTFAPKAQGGVAGAPNSVSTATHGGTGWETITVTFNEGLDNTTTANGVYAAFAIHYLWDTTTNNFLSPAVNRVIYVDNIVGVAAAESTITPPSTAAPTPPAREASDVISFYSDAYSATGLTNFDAGWCGANSVTEISVEANAVMAWNTNPCQGIEFTAIDATSFTNLHFDLYIAAETDMIGKVFNLKFVETSSGAFKEVNFNSGSTPALVAGQWNSVDVVVDLSDYEALNQFAITSNINNYAWYDNMYLWKEPTASGTDVTLSDLTIDGTTIAGFAAGATSYTVDLVQGTTTAPSIAAVPTDSNATVDVTDATSVPGSGIVVVTSADGTTTATITVSFTANIPAVDAPAPTQLEADVVSVYSDTFSTNILTNNNPGWGQATQVTEVQLGASNNNTLKYSNLNYQGMLYDATDVSSMDYVHLDYYTNDATALEFFVIKDGTGENTYDIAGTIGITTGEWVSVDIPLAHYTVTDLTGVNQFKTAGNGTVYLDNLFFWNTPTASVEDFATNSVKMYPNPAKGVVNFSSASNVALDVAVYDMLGKQVLRANAVQSQLNISSLNPGMYFVKMTQGSNVSTKKLLVN